MIGGSGAYIIFSILRISASSIELLLNLSMNRAAINTAYEGRQGPTAMYGLVNKAVEQLVRSQFGDSTWYEIAKRANVEYTFISMDAYPDTVTYDLVEAASEILEIPAAEILEAFGEHWIQYTVDEGYGQMISMYGNSVHEFLQNMNNLHAQIRLILPELNPPTISCDFTESGDLLVCYESERAGLAPMLVGLLRGLGERFSTPVNVEYVPPAEKHQTQEYFLISYSCEKAA